VLLVQNPRVSKAGPLVARLAELVSESGAQVRIARTIDEAGIEAGLREVDLVVTVGGDGTILRVARFALRAGVPVLGVNLGELGFLAELSPEQAVTVLPELLAGGGWLEERVAMEVMSTACQTACPLIAINDVQIGRGELSRVVKIGVRIGDTGFTSYLGDGVLVATPTGSTAYSLAAGGPVLDPRLESLVLTPLVPYLSFPYPVVLAPNTTLRLTVSTDYTAALTVDGQVDVPLRSGDVVTISQAANPVRFLRCGPPEQFYRTLTRRLRPDHFWDEGDAS
jgi:NAD+ kinase